MNNRRTKRFRKALADLPEHAQLRARQAFRTFVANPDHPSLRFKQVHPRRPIYSARVGLGYRALAVRQGDTLIWFWIGSHSDYDELLRRT